MKTKKRNPKKRYTLAQQFVRLKRANDRAEARVKNIESRSAFAKRFVWWVKRPLDVESERPTSRLAPLEWMAKLEPPTRDPPKERAEKPPPPPT